MLIDHNTAFENYLSVDHLMAFSSASHDQVELDAPAAARPQTGGVLPGLLIETAQGFRQARSLRPGDMVQTYDGGLREIINVRHSVPRLTAMVHVPAGVLGNDADVSLPSDMLVAVTGDLAEEVFDRPVVTVKIVGLIGYHGIAAALPQNLARIHIECEEEELLWAEGGMVLNANEACDDGFYDLLSFAETRRLVNADATNTATASEETPVLELASSTDTAETPELTPDTSTGFDWCFKAPHKALRFDTLDLLFGRYAA